MCGRFDNLIARDAYRGLFKGELDIDSEDINRALRADDGRLFRALLEKLSRDDSAEATRLAEEGPWLV
jgi:hypothetical protein